MGDGGAAGGSPEYFAACRRVPGYAARVVLFKSRFSPLWRIDRIIPQCNVPRVMCQLLFTSFQRFFRWHSVRLKADGWSRLSADDTGTDRRYTDATA